MSMRTKLPRDAASSTTVRRFCAADVVVEVQPERGELDADVRVEPAVLDVGEHVLVCAHDRGRLVLVGDLLAEDVDRRQLAFGVDPPDVSRASFSSGPAM